MLLLFFGDQARPTAGASLQGERLDCWETDLMTVAGRVGSGTGEARDGKATATCILDMLRGNSVSGGLLFGCQLETWQETI